MGGVEVGDELRPERVLASKLAKAMSVAETPFDTELPIFLVSGEDTPKVYQKRGHVYRPYEIVSCWDLTKRAPSLMSYQTDPYGDEYRVPTYLGHDGRLFTYGYSGHRVYSIFRRHKYDNVFFVWSEATVGEGESRRIFTSALEELLVGFAST